MQDSLEDELSTCNESVATEPSFVDENLVFNENKRVPFFKVSGTNVSFDLVQQRLWENIFSEFRESKLSEIWGLAVLAGQSLTEEGYHKCACFRV